MKFVSKCANQVLTIKPNRSQVVEGIIVTVPGEHVRFSNHEYDTEDKAIIAWLNKHRLSGFSFTEADVKSAGKTAEK